MDDALSKLVDTVAGHLHADQKIDAARALLALTASTSTLRNEEAANPHLLTFLHFLLNSDKYELASKVLWTPTMFTAEPECTRSVWDAIRTSRAVLLQGAASMSKTYCTGVFYFLDWLRDPEFTTVKVIGPSEDHLQSNLFSHLINLHQNASLPLPGYRGDLFIGLNLRNRRGAISGVVVPVGRKAAGRLQGNKRFPRPQPHERFGPLSRLRVLIDELEKVPPGIWADIDNLTATAEGIDGYKIVCSYNPQDVGGMTYKKAEPKLGWNSFNIETDHRWESTFGWNVVRLDGERSENVLQNKVVYPGLQTAEGLEMLAKSTGGRMSAGYYTFGRGAYPDQGTIFSVFPTGLCPRMKARVLWRDEPRSVGSCDPALEGDDAAMFAQGLWGLATGFEYPPTVDFPKGRIVMFKSRNGIAEARHALLLNQLVTLPRGNTVTMARQIRELCRKLAIDPSWLLLDRTGNAAGVHDLLKEIWDPSVRGVNYSEGATSKKIMAEDTTIPSEDYDRVCSELWFAAKKWADFDVLKVNPSVDTGSLFSQLTSRLYLNNGRKTKVEHKSDWKHKNQGKSPGEADAFTLLVHLVRIASEVTPGMVVGDLVPEGGYGYGDAYGPAMVGVTDRLTDDLDAPERPLRPRPFSEDYSNNNDGDIM